MADILKLARVQIVVIVFFAFFKFLRPSVLKTEAPELVKIFLWSFPNFCEAIVGVMTLTAIGLVINRRLRFKKRFKEKNVYVLAVLLAAVYVISQELKFHNLGGHNVYDPIDLVFSIIGLLTGYFIVTFIQPVVTEETNNS